MPPTDNPALPAWELEQQAQTTIQLSPAVLQSSSSSGPTETVAARAQYAGPIPWLAAHDLSDSDLTELLNVQGQSDLYQGQHWSDQPTALHHHLDPNPNPGNLVNPSPTSFLPYSFNDTSALFQEDQHGARPGLAFPVSLPVPSSRSATSPSAATEASYVSNAPSATRASRDTGNWLFGPSQPPVSTIESSIIGGSGRKQPVTRPTAGIGVEGIGNRIGATDMNRVSQSIERISDDGRTFHFGRQNSQDSMRGGIVRGSHHEDNRSSYVNEEVRPVGPPLESSVSGRSGNSSLRHRQMENQHERKSGLPAEKGFSIQVGSELFRLSGASIMSDAPSYFSKHFEDQMRLSEGDGGINTLYIDRDPATFQDIARHLQGYYVQPRDGGHYVRLFADAQFYGLPRLIKQLFDSEICIQIGDQDFQIPRDIFSSPGDSPNFFSLGFGAFFNDPNEVFPGINRHGLLRPPPITAPSVQNRSAHIFSDLLHLLRGYPLHIRNSDHRAELLRDCRYFHLRGLEQKLIVHHISYNVERQKSEIILRLDDIRQSGVSFVGDASPSDRSPLGGWVNYARPFVDEMSYELIIEVGDESIKVDFRSMRADFYNDAKARITSLFQVVANKMNLPTNLPLGLMMSSGGVAAQPVSPGNTPLSEDRVKIRIEQDAHLLLDGEEYLMDSSTIDAYDYSGGQEVVVENGSSTYMSASTGRGSTSNRPASDQGGLFQPSRSSSTKPPARKRKRQGSLEEFGEWVIRKGQWRLRVQPRPEQPNQIENRMEIVLYAVKLDAISGQKGRNALRDFLS